MISVETGVAEITFSRLLFNFCVNSCSIIRKDLYCQDPII